MGRRRGSHESPTTLGRFRERPSALAGCFAGAVVVQAVLVLLLRRRWPTALGIPIPPWHLAVVVPVSFVVQMLPVSVNGFGVREATFSFYFSRLGLPIESALALSLGATGLIMLFSLLRRRGATWDDSSGHGQLGAGRSC